MSAPQRVLTDSDTWGANPSSTGTHRLSLQTVAHANTASLPVLVQTAHTSALSSAEASCLPVSDLILSPPLVTHSCRAGLRTACCSRDSRRANCGAQGQPLVPRCYSQSDGPHGAMLASGTRPGSCSTVPCVVNRAVRIQKLCKRASALNCSAYRTAEAALPGAGQAAAAHLELELPVMFT